MRSSPIQKKAGSRFTKQCLLNCNVICGIWSFRNFIMTKYGISTQSMNGSGVDGYMVFDQNFQVVYGKRATKYKYGVTLKSSQRIIKLFFKNKTLFFDFLYCIQQSLQQSPYYQKNRFHSFSPIRNEQLCKWYVDSEGYFSDIKYQILHAQQEIFITDWWLSPQLFMNRPINQDDDQDIQNYRLDHLLLKAAKNGVIVRIITWQDHPITGIANDSLFTQTHLQSLHENIIVLRHPNYLLPHSWSHHEKMLVVDQRIGFMGGLDLCYGRWDNKNHDLFNDNDSLKKQWPGIDYCNPRIKDFSSVKNYKQFDIEPQQPRMPWHDIALQVRGNAVIDMCRHFIQYWNYVTIDVEYGKQHILDQPQISVIKQQKIIKEIKDNTNDKYTAVDQNDKETKKNQDIQQRGRIKSLEHINPIEYNQAINQISNNKTMNSNNQNKNNQQLQPRQKKRSVIKSKFRGYYQKVKYNVNKKLHDRKLKNEEKDDYYILQIKRIESEHDETIHSHVNNQSYLPNLESKKMTSQQQQQKQQLKNVDISYNDLEESDINELHKKNSNSVQNRNFKVNQSFKPQQMQNKNEQNNMQTPQNQDVQNDQIQLNIINATIKAQSDQNQVQVVEIEDNKMSKSEQKQNLQINLIQEDGGSNQLSRLQQFEKIYQNSSVKNHNDQKNNQYDDIQFHLKKAKKAQGIMGKNEKEQKNGKHKKDKHGDHFMEQNQIQLKPLQINKVISDQNEENQELKTQFSNCTMQLVRSSSLWSLGLEYTEHSIYLSYLKLIAESQHFIYIENQFFISNTSPDIDENAQIQNKIAWALIERIKMAHEKKQNFKVIVVMPLLPAFSGEVNSEAEGRTMRIQLFWEYMTISRGGNSIYEILERDLKMDREQIREKYIQFYGLRNHQKMEKNGKKGEYLYETEQIYVHSKLMIVDDRNVIIGSANCNDRSMLGSRDSELAMVIEGECKNDCLMDNKPYKNNNFAHSLRKYIFNEHFGLSFEQVSDPLSKEFNTSILKNSKVNTDIYRDLFKVYPDNTVKTFKDLQNFRIDKSKDSKEYQQDYDNKVQNIIGHAVEFPLDFLINEDLSFKSGQLENYLPQNIFT